MKDLETPPQTGEPGMGNNPMNKRKPREEIIFYNEIS